MGSRSPGAPDPPRRAWPTRDVLRVAALLVGAYIAIRLLWAASSVLLLTFLGVLFGLALAAGVDRLERLRVPRVIGAAAIVLTVGGVLVGVGRLIAPTITEQWGEVSERLPDVMTRIRGWLNSPRAGMVGLIAQGPETARQQQPPADTSARPAPGPAVVSQVVDRFGDVGRRFFAIFSSTLAALAGLLLVFFVAIYVAVEPRLYERGIMHLVPRRARPKARDVLGHIAYMLRRWLLAQGAAMIAVGALTTVVLTLLDVRGALALGVIAGLLEFVPIAGPIAASVPGIGMALLDGADKAAYVTLAYIGVQQAEAQLITPLVMKEGLELPPVLTIVAQAVMSIVFGFVGLLVAVPLLGAVFVAVKMMYVRDVVGDEVPLPGDEKS